MGWRGRVNRVAQYFGYEIHRRGAEDTYLPCPPYGYFSYAPWFEPWFQKKFSLVKEHALINEAQGYMLHRLCQVCMRLPGDLAECGVYRGGSAALIADTLVEGGIFKKQLHLFDTFGGLPDTGKLDPRPLRKGDFKDTSLEYVQGILRNYSFAQFHQGVIPNTLVAVEGKQFAMVHLDLVLYSATLEALKFFYPRLSSGGMIICDDYGLARYQDSVRLAVDQFLEDRQEAPIALHNGQCLIIKSSDAVRG